jgi:DNA-binding SARP family transcriptional activator
VDFAILGPLEVRDDGRPIELAGRRQRALLAILLLHAGEVVSSDRLIDDLWGDEPPDAGAAALRVRLSQLRKTLGPEGNALIVARPPGYVLRVDPEQVDLRRFERLAAAGERALADGDPRTAVDRLTEAGALWRGPALADFAYAPFAQAAIARLEELRLAAAAARIEAELALGRHGPLVAELESLVREHPLSERLTGLLMLALYRDGRQAEALAAYRAQRRRLVDEVGIEPGRALQALERRILAQDAALDLGDAVAAPARALLVASLEGAPPEPLVALAESLARRAEHELLVTALVADDAALARDVAALGALRDAAAGRGTAARVAAFTSTDPGGDAVRLVADQDVALLVLGALGDVLETGTPGAGLATVLAGAVCDVALVAGAERPLQGGGGRAVLVPFAGHDHDWTAVELAAWLAGALGAPLRLLGTRADPDEGRRDASRLLANASLVVQRGLGIAADPLLVDRGADGIVRAAAGGAAVVLGLSERWPRDGLGATRLEVARRAPAPVVLVRRGLRPGGLAPPDARTRFTWSRRPA